MAGLAANFHRIAGPTGQRLRQGLAGIQRFAPLVQRDLEQVGADFYFSRVGFGFPGQQIEQRGFAGAVGTDDAHPVATDHAG